MAVFSALYRAKHAVIRLLQHVFRAPAGYWSMEQAQEVINKPRSVVLDPGNSSLTEAEGSAVTKLQSGIPFPTLSAWTPEIMEALSWLMKQGDAKNVGEFSEKSISWTPKFHARLAERLRIASSNRFVTMRYKPLEKDF